MVLHLYKLESPSPKDALSQIWLKLAQRFWRWRFLNFVNVFSLFHNYHPLEKDWALHLNKLRAPNFFNQETLGTFLKALSKTTNKMYYPPFVSIFWVFLYLYWPKWVNQCQKILKSQTTLLLNHLCKTSLQFAYPHLKVTVSESDWWKNRNILTLDKDDFTHFKKWFLNVNPGFRHSATV